MALEVNAAVFAQVESSGPYALNVIEPPAAPPAFVGLITGVPGSFAVLPSVPVSLMGEPSATFAEALVDSVGASGLTVKHSVALWSLDWMPVVASGG